MAGRIPSVLPSVPGKLGTVKCGAASCVTRGHVSGSGKTSVMMLAVRHAAPGEREVGAVERTHNFMCSKPLDSRFLRISFYWRRAACGSSGLSAPSSSSAARHVRPWRRAWVVNREELFIMIHRIRSYAVVGSRDAQEKQTSLPQNSMRAPRSSPCKQPFTGPSRTRTLRSFALAKSPVRLTSSPKLIGCESSASLSAPTRFGAMQREQAAPHALS